MIFNCLHKITFHEIADDNITVEGEEMIAIELEEGETTIEQA